MIEIHPGINHQIITGFKGLTCVLVSAKKEHTEVTKAKLKIVRYSVKKVNIVGQPSQKEPFP